MNSRKVLKLVSISEVASKMESMKRTWSDWRCAYDTQNGLSRHVPPASDAEGSVATFKDPKQPNRCMVGGQYSASVLAAASNRLAIVTT